MGTLEGNQRVKQGLQDFNTIINNVSEVEKHFSIHRNSSFQASLSD